MRTSETRPGTWLISQWGGYRPLLCTRDRAWVPELLGLDRPVATTNEPSKESRRIRSTTPWSSVRWVMRTQEPVGYHGLSTDGWSNWMLMVQGTNQVSSDIPREPTSFSRHRTSARAGARGGRPVVLRVRAPRTITSFSVHDARLSALCSLRLIEFDA